MSKKFYAQTDLLGFPIIGTMMSASEVPTVDNILEINQEMTLPAHPSGVKYYLRLDEKGAILPNSLFQHYGTLDQDDVVSLQQEGAVPPPPPPPPMVSHWRGNLYRGNCDASLTTGTPLTVTDGTAIEIGKFYKVGTDAWLITATNEPDGMAITINDAIAFNSCAAALA